MRHYAVLTVRTIHQISYMCLKRYQEIHKRGKEVFSIRISEQGSHIHILGGNKLLVFASKLRLWQEHFSHLTGVGLQEVWRVGDRQLAVDLRPERVHPQLHGLPVCEEPHLALLPQLPRASGRLHHHQLTPHLHGMLDCYTPVVGLVRPQSSSVPATVVFTETVDVLVRECTSAVISAYWATVVWTLA